MQTTINPIRPPLYEACVETLEDAQAAEQRGAHRIELCAALALDGLSPSRDLVRQCVQNLSLPIMVMVRPRGGDFVYTEAEICAMEADIFWLKSSGAAGVVLGLLTRAGEIDLANTERLARAASPLAVTFHKAIDASADLLRSFQALNAIEPISRVLSSGGQASAWEGRATLRAMNALAGRRISLIAAGKLTPENRERLAKYTGVFELHGKRIV